MPSSKVMGMESDSSIPPFVVEENAGEDDHQSEVELVTSTSPNFNRRAQIITIQETLAENILLKRELRSKLEQLTFLRNQLQRAVNPQATNEIANPALEEGEHFNRQYLLDESGDAHMDLTNFLHQTQDRSVAFEDVTQGSEHLSISRTVSEIVEWVENNRSEVIDKVGKGSIVARDLVLGGVSGWISAFVLKKFGSVAATALGGGLLLIQLANHRGYVVVNWNQIFNQLERSTIDFEGDEGMESSPADWFGNRVKKLRKWSKDNRNLALGFMGGFLYKTYA